MSTVKSPARKAAAISLIAALAFGILSVTYRAMFAPNPVPEVKFRTLTGEAINTSDLRGKVVLVNFWATSCVTCVKEMPQVVATHDKFKARGLDTLAVAMSYDPPAYVANFASSRKLPFGVAIDNTGDVAKQFGQVQLTPTSFLINKRGEIVKRYVGEPDFGARLFVAKNQSMFG